VTDRIEIIDTNLTIGHWPFRCFPAYEPDDLLEKLRSHNVTQAWTGSFEGLFHRDLSGVNRRLVEFCRRHAPDRLIPFGSINPTLPNWEDDFRQCHQELGMRGIRLHPNYHRYSLEEPFVESLFERSSKAGFIVQIVMSMEDERTQSTLMPVPHVDWRPLVKLVKTLPELRIVLLNAFRAMPVATVTELIGSGQVFTDIAMLEGLGGLTDLFGKISSERIVFGSHYPLFYYESSVLKLRESELGEQQTRSISHLNARQLFSDLRRSS